MAVSGLASGARLGSAPAPPTSAHSSNPSSEASFSPNFEYRYRYVSPPSPAKRRFGMYATMSPDPLPWFRAASSRMNDSPSAPASRSYRRIARPPYVPSAVYPVSCGWSEVEICSSSSDRNLTRLASR